MNYAKLAFTQAIKKLQLQNGSRASYENMEKFNHKEGLGLYEINMIQNQDHFYMASIGENGFPYIQHKGGPKGFLKVLDAQTLAFLDFSGNKQYITFGNVQTKNKISLILVDYPSKTRLKIYVEAEISPLPDHPDLVEKLELEDYDYRSERILFFHIKAFDWNCPKHITPRYTIAEMDNLINSINE